MKRKFKLQLFAIFSSFSLFLEGWVVWRAFDQKYKLGEDRENSEDVAHPSLSWFVSAYFPWWIEGFKGKDSANAKGFSFANL